MTKFILFSGYFMDTSHLYFYMDFENAPMIVCRSTLSKDFKAGELFETQQQCDARFNYIVKLLSE